MIITAVSCPLLPNQCGAIHRRTYRPNGGRDRVRQQKETPSQGRDGGDARAEWGSTTVAGYGFLRGGCGSLGRPLGFLTKPIAPGLLRLPSSVFTTLRSSLGSMGLWQWGHRKLLIAAFVI
jgi:hypothetical protein